MKATAMLVLNSLPPKKNIIRIKMKLNLKKCTILIMMSVSSLSFLFASCISRQEREYRHICDSLNNLDFSPRVFDTLFFQKYGNGFEVDTITLMESTITYRETIKVIIPIIIKYANTPIIDFITYGGDDGKIIDWHQSYYNWEDISSYWVFYDKEGKVYDYYICTGCI